QCTRCYFCNERCPKGVDPRDAIAKLGAESISEGVDRDMGAKHAKWFVRSAMTTGWLRETELVPKTQGIVESIRQARFAIKLARACRARVGHLPRRRSRPRGGAGLLPAPGPPATASRLGERRRPAAHGLQRVQAQPPAGQLAADRRRRAARARKRGLSVGRSP